MYCAYFWRGQKLLDTSFMTQLSHILRRPRQLSKVSVSKLPKQNSDDDTYFSAPGTYALDLGPLGSFLYVHIAFLYGSDEDEPL